MSKGSGRSSLASCPAVLEDLAFHPVSLIFRGGDGKVEGRYLAEVAASRYQRTAVVACSGCSHQGCHEALRLPVLCTAGSLL